MTTAIENAKYLARRGFLVFPASAIFGPGAESIATSDLSLMDTMHSIDPSAKWLVRCGTEFSLLALDTPRARDLDLLVADVGKLPATMIVARPSGGPIRWFTVDADADVKLGTQIAGSRARYRRSAIIPGSLHSSGEAYEVLGGKPFDLDWLAALPESWLQAAPKNAIGVTANFVSRHEYEKPRPSYW